MAHFFKKYLFLFIITPFLFSACSTQVGDVTDLAQLPEADQANVSEDSLKVITTFPPLYSLTQNIIGDLGEVTNLVPAGVSVHTWEPKASDLRALTEADLLVMNGLELETFVEDMVEAVENDSLKIVTTSDAVSGLIESPEHLELASEKNDPDKESVHGHEEGDQHDEHHEEEDDHEHEEHHEEHHEEEGDHAHNHEEGHSDHHDETEDHGDDDHHDHDEEGHHDDEHHEEKDDHDDHQHGGTDPHVWLNPLLAMQQVEAIRDTLIEVAPEHEVIFRENTEVYLAELKNFDEQIREEFEDISFQNFIVFHDAYTYYFNAYGLLDYRKAAVESFPGSEPGAAYVQNLIELIEEENIKVIFTEPQFNSTLVQRIQEETGIKSFELDPIGSDLSARGYRDLLRELTRTFVEAFE